MTYQYQEVKKTEKKQEPDLFDYEQQHQQVVQGHQKDIEQYDKEQQVKKHETGYEPTFPEEKRIEHNITE